MKKTDTFQTSNAEMVTISRAEYEKLQPQSKRALRLKVVWMVLVEALRLARHKQFGASSEKSEETLMEQLSFLFNEAEVFAAVKEEENTTVVAAHKRHKKHEYTLDSIPEDLLRERIVCRLEGDNLVCPRCADTMTEIGTEVVNKLRIIPAQVIVEQHAYYSYACQNCNKEDIETPVVKAPHEKSVIPGSFATPEAIAHFITQKFVMGSPLYRQGISLSRQTMSNWILRAAEDYLTPVYEQLHRELLAREVLHADETTLQVLHTWKEAPDEQLYVAVSDQRRHGQPHRSVRVPARTEHRASGDVSQGLQGVSPHRHSLPDGITVVGCWAHLHRKFDETMKSLPKGKAKGSSAYQGLAFCNLLFAIEKGLAEKNATTEDRYKERLEQQRRSPPLARHLLT